MLLRHAILWTLDRRDSVTLRLTDHNAPLMVDTGDGEQEYTPVAGVDASALREEAGLHAANTQIAGMLSSDLITEADIRAGRYRRCEVTLQLTDWQFPWPENTITLGRFIIQEVKWTDLGWEAQIVSLAHLLGQEVGRVYTRTCRHRLGDEGCKVDLGPLTETRTVTTAHSTRPAQSFFATGLSGSEDNHYEFGVVTWLTGDNAGLESEVMNFNAEHKRVELAIKLPFTIKVGDEFTLHPGCNKTRDHCENKFVNLTNFGGFPAIPGTDRALETPRVKA